MNKKQVIIRIRFLLQEIDNLLVSCPRNRYLIGERNGLIKVLKIINAMNKIEKRRQGNWGQKIVNQLLKLMLKLIGGKNAVLADSVRNKS